MTTVDNSKDQGYSGYSTDGGNNTEDKVFLLSYAEANKYLGITDDGYNEELGVEATAYAKKQGAFADDNDKTAWWLRSPGKAKGTATFVASLSSIGFKNVDDSDLAVRPALWVNLESGIF